MSAYERVRDLRERLRPLIAGDQSDPAVQRELSNLAFNLRQAHDDWFAAEVHTWTQLPLNELLKANWEKISAWCEQNVSDRDWLIYLPKAKPRAVYFRKPGDAVMLKMLFG